MPPLFIRFCLPDWWTTPGHAALLEHTRSDSRLTRRTGEEMLLSFIKSVI